MVVIMELGPTEWRPDRLPRAETHAVVDCGERVTLGYDSRTKILSLIGPNVQTHYEAVESFSVRK